MTKKKHEELVEEIAGRIRHYKHFAEKRYPTASERIKASFDLAELFVADVLSAVRDGRLELPGQKWRKTSDFAFRIAITKGEMDSVRVGDTIIVLGKEEE